MTWDAGVSGCRKDNEIVTRGGTMSASSKQQDSQGSGRVALTPRQFAVGALVARGLTNAEVAERLGLSVATVKVYRREAMQRLGASSPVQLVRHFLGVPASAAVGNVARLVQPLQVHVVDADDATRRALVQALRQRGIPTQPHPDVEALLDACTPCDTDVVLLALTPRQGPMVDPLDFAPLAAVRHISPCGLLALLPCYRAPHWTEAREQGADGVFSRPAELRELHAAIMNLYARLGHGAAADVDSPAWPANLPTSAKPLQPNGSKLTA